MENGNISLQRKLSSHRLRALIEDVTNMKLKKNLLRNNVLQGFFYSNAIDLCEWETKAFKLAVFVSSTFTDTQLERCFLMDILYFELREKGFSHDIQVIFVDMRWGVQDQSTLDHKTWIECARGIDWCIAESAGIAFFSLQGDKYGYTPLPKSIKQVDLDARLRDCSEEIRQLANHYYRIDENALEKSYVLQNLTILSDSAFWKAFDILLPALYGVPFDTERQAGLLVGKSVTEWEVRAGLKYELERSDAFCWSYRKLAGEITNKAFCDFDNSSPNLRDSYNSLISMMKENFPEAEVRTYDNTLTLSDILANDAEEVNLKKIKYLEEFKDFTRTKITASLHGIIDDQQQWIADGAGLGISGEEATEMLHHCSFAHRKCSTFVGRKALVDVGIFYVKPHLEQWTRPLILSVHSTSTMASPHVWLEYPEQVMCFIVSI